MDVVGFMTPVVVDLAGLKATSQRIPAFLNHDPNQIVGLTDAVEIDRAGVRLKGIVTAEDGPAQTVVSNARNGFAWQASIGAEILRQEYVKTGEKVTVNGHESQGPLLIAREARLYEISFVPLGADGNTSASVAAHLTSKGQPMTFEAYLAARGADAAKPDPTKLAALRADYEREHHAAQGATTTATTAQTESVAGGSQQTVASVIESASRVGRQTLEEVMSAHRAEQDRQRQITDLVAEAIRDRPASADEFERIGKTGIECQSPVRDVEIAILRVRASGPSRVVGGGDRRVSQRVIEAAVCLSGGLDDPEKHFDETTLNAADTRFPQGLGLQDLFLLAARENGYTGFGISDLRNVLRFAFGMDVKASGFSTLSLPGILSNVANKYLLTAFNAVETGWRDIAAIRRVSDLKSITSYTLTSSGAYQKIGPSGEIKHATLGETGYSNKADTYGQMFSITREHIINDDLGALTAVPSKLGRNGALTLNEVFWTEFLADLNTFYSAGHANVSTGAGSALSSAGLQAALLKFRKQTGPDSKPLGVMPKLLVVPVELEITAGELMTSNVVNTGGSSTTDKVPNRNVWSSKFGIVSSSYLSNSSITGYSTAAWFLVADPADLAVIEVAFLNGRQVPTIESADAEFNVLGVQMRAFHDFGVAKQEYRASVRSAGS